MKELQFDLTLSVDTEHTFRGLPIKTHEEMETAGAWIMDSVMGQYILCHPTFVDKLLNADKELFNG